MKQKILITLLMMLCSSSLFAYDYVLDKGGAIYHLEFISATECKIAEVNVLSDHIEIPGEFEYEGRTMTITTIGHSAFDWTDIQSVEIPNSVTTIEDFAFWYCQKLNTVTIGNGIKSLGVYAFVDCPSLRKVRVYAEVPPFCMESFSPGPNAVLEVPVASKMAYSEANGWKDFSNIVNIISSEQCAAPIITVADGKLQVECETEDATIHYEINGSGEMKAGEFTFPSTFEITAYATLEGILPSDSVIQTVYLPVSSQSPDTGVTEIYIYDDTHTDITLTSGDVVTLSIKDGIIYIESVPLNAHVGVYSIVGETIMTQVALEDTVIIKLPRNDTYIIKVGEKAFKVKI